METQIRSIGIKVRDLAVIEKRLVGIVADELLPPTPRVPVSVRKAREAFRLQIQKHQLATSVPPFYLPLANQAGFFRPIHPAVLTDFIAHSEDSEERAISFIRKYGVWSEDDLYEDGEEGFESRAMQTWWEDAKRRQETPFTVRLCDIWDARKLAINLSELKAALLRFDMGDVTKLCSEVGRSFIQNYNQASKLEQEALEKEAHFLLCLGTGWMLAGARFAPVEENGKQFPVVSTAFSREAVFAQLALHLVEGNPLRSCLRKQCTNVFVPGAHDNQYCSAECQQRNKRARQLGKPKEEIERSSVSLRGR